MLIRVKKDTRVVAEEVAVLILCFHKKDLKTVRL
jgi:hypothetical protein